MGIETVLIYVQAGHREMIRLAVGGRGMVNHRQTGGEKNKNVTHNNEILNLLI